ncbi:MAG: hypothetical protein LBP59_18215 [Planctomycetaceae bacterium]|jgi:hypothetical protein|nr:hypothetical protein [Planctomycetaceae bacterium]
MSIKSVVFCVLFTGCFLLQYFLPFCLWAAELSEKQRILANRYAQLEQALSRMAIATAQSDPKRAALLEKVLILSKEKLVGNRLENIVVLLEKNRLSDSALGQKEVEKDIIELLQILESDNKKDVNALKREQLQKLIKELTELYNQQRINAQRAASQDKENLKSVADEQERLRRLTDELRKNLDELEGRNSSKSTESKEDKSDNSKDGKPDDSKDGKSGESKDGQSGESKDGQSGESKDGQSGESKDGQSGESKDGKSGESKDGKSGESKDGQSGESKDGQSGESKDGQSGESKDGQSGESKDGQSGESKDGQSGESKDGQSGKSKKGQSGGQSGESGEGNESKDDDKNSENESDSDANSDEENTPQKDLKKATKHQRQAKKNLQDKKKSDAHSDMDAAAAEIIRAKEKLLRMLRQLREEELMQTLEKLGARFKRMLQVEQSIRTQTELLGNEIKLLSTGSDGGEMRQIKIKAGKLGDDQGLVIDDADAALVLLREDGTAQAMLESLLQVRFDVEEIKARLVNTEVDTVTLEVEDAVIAALQEMIDAVEEAIKESKERQDDMKKNQDPIQQDSEKEEPLIKLLAELKMIKSMQKRVNERTERYEKLTTKKLQDDPASDLEPIRKNVEELTRQQNRISRILHDIKIGKIKK